MSVLTTQQVAQTAAYWALQNFVVPNVTANYSLDQIKTAVSAVDAAFGYNSECGRYGSWWGHHNFQRTVRTDHGKHARGVSHAADIARLLCADEARWNYLMARSFNGSSDRITAAGGPTVGPPITLSAWVYKTSQSGQNDIFDFGVNSTGLSYRFATGFTTDQIFTADDRGSSGTNEVSLNSGNTFSLNTWAHGCGVFLGASGLVTYCNGVKSSSGAAGNGGTRQGFSVGALNVAGGGTFNFFPGLIADCAAWNVQLTDAEVAALAMGVRPYNIRPASLIGYFPLDGFQSPEPDLSGNANNGTLTGTALAAGPPLMMFTPRSPLITPATAGSTGFVYPLNFPMLGM